MESKIRKKEIRNRISKTFRQKRLRRSTSPFDRKRKSTDRQTDRRIFDTFVNNYYDFVCTNISP